MDVMSSFSLCPPRSLAWTSAGQDRDAEGTACPSGVGVSGAQLVFYALLQEPHGHS